MSQPRVKVEHVAKGFGRKPVLTDVSLTVQPGEFIGIAGENGAGKTTLLKILVGLLKPDAGNVDLQGTFGYCPQDLLVFERLTVQENLKYFGAAYGLKISESEPVSDELLERFRFSQYRDTLVSRLSGGTKQKLNLVLALLHQPDVVILDEPYAAFDWESYLHFWDYSQELRSQGKIILLVSHLIYDQNKIDTLYEIRSGELLCVHDT